MFVSLFIKTASAILILLAIATLIDFVVRAIGKSN